MAIQSGKLWPRACLSLTSLSTDTVSSLVRGAGKRDFGTVLSTCAKLTEFNFLVLPMCDLISFAPCGETFLLILILPQPFQRVCSIGVLAEVLAGVLVGSLSFEAVSKEILSVLVEIAFLRKRDVMLLIGTYLSILYIVKLYINWTQVQARSLLSCSNITRLPCVQIILNRLSLLFKFGFRCGLDNWN